MVFVFLFLISLSIILSRCIHFVVNGKTSVVFYGRVASHCLYTHLLPHPSVGAHLGGFRVLATVSNAAMNMRVRMFFQISVFIFFGCISRSGSYGSCLRIYYQHYIFTPFHVLDVKFYIFLSCVSLN